MAVGGPLLYVHPYNHVLDELVPMGAVALVNRCDVPKVGRYAWELTEAEVRAAGCVALDLHWYFSIEAVGWIARDIKRLAPDVPIVVGGITASFYAKHLLEIFPIDYIVQGDGEHTFPRLVECLVEGRRPPALPNLWTRSAPPPPRRPVSAAEYDGNDYLTLDWFPALAAHTRANHEEYEREPFWGRMDRYHPYIPLNRGCRFPCNGCFGSYQHDAFGPGQVDRSAASLARLLDGAEAHPDYRFVNLTAGTEDLSRIDAFRETLGSRRALGAYVMHFCDLPADEDLDLILGAFDRVCMDFTNPEDVPLPLRASGWTIEGAQDRILEIAAAVDGLDTMRMGVSFMSTEPHPFKDRLRARNWERLQLKENSEWSLPRPNHATLPGFAGQVDPGDAGVARTVEAATRGAQALGQELPRFPIPTLERRFLTAEQRTARDAAKGAQADAFRAVSRGHGRYLLARGLSPALHALLDQSYLQRVDGSAVTPLELDDPEVAAFRDWYVDRYRTWFVTTLDEVEVVVRALTSGPEGPGLVEGAPGEDLGLATIRPSMDGVRVAWSGTAPAGTTGLAFRARLAWIRDGEAAWLDPLLLGLPLIALPCGPGSVGLFSTLSPGGCTIALHDSVDSDGAAVPTGSPRAAWAWPMLETRPASPWDPAEDLAHDQDLGPTDLVEAPFADPSWPERVAQALDEALASGAIPGWTGTLREQTMRWVWHELVHDSGLVLRSFVLPPGPARCVWHGQLCRLLLQEGSEGAMGDSASHAAIGQLEEVLAALERQTLSP